MKIRENIYLDVTSLKILVNWIKWTRYRFFISIEHLYSMWIHFTKIFKSNLPAGTFTAFGWWTGSQPALEQIRCDAVTFASAQEILLLMYIFQRWFRLNHGHTLKPLSKLEARVFTEPGLCSVRMRFEVSFSKNCD